MTDEISYGGKPLSQYSLWELGQFKANIEKAEEQREKASKHVKFNEDRVINNKTVQKINFPDPNPNYFKIKEAIEEEIRKRQNV